MRAIALAVLLFAGCGSHDDSGTDGDADTDGDTDSDADTDSDTDTDADADGIIPEDRRVDWAPGVPGGIPAIDTVCAVVTDPPYDAVGDGIADDSGAIQSAIDDCPEGQVVRIPAGTYRLADRLYVTKGIVLRGDGPGETRLEGDGVSSRAILQIGEEWDYDGLAETSVTDGLAKGSATIEVADASGFAVGDVVIVDQQNDGDLVSLASSESDCTWGSREDGNRLIGQISEITSVDGASVGIDPPLGFAYDAALAPEMLMLNTTITRRAGVEDLTIADRSYRGDNNGNIRFHACVECWAKNVESDMVSGRHIDFNRTLRCEVRDSWVHHAHCYRPGANAYGIAIQNQSTSTLVENDVVYYLNVGIVMGSSGPGNVVAYNRGDTMWDSNYPDTGWLMADLSANHCAHPFMTLYEGNVGSQISGDDIHGGSSHQTFFRNAMDHAHGDVDTTGNVFSVVFAARNRYMNVVGNVFGQPGDVGEYEADQNCDEGLAVYKLGWPSDCGAGAGEIDPEVAATILRHGNFDYVVNDVVWDDAIETHSLPPSLYLEGRPSWFGDTLAWPPIGPDVEGMTGETPASQRFDSLPHEVRGGDGC